MDQDLIVIIINNKRKERRNSNFDLEVIIVVLSGISHNNDREEIYCHCVLICS